MVARRIRRPELSRARSQPVGAEHERRPEKRRGALGLSPRGGCRATEPSVEALSQHGKLRLAQCRFARFPDRDPVRITPFNPLKRGRAVSRTAGNGRNAKRTER